LEEVCFELGALIGFRTRQFWRVLSFLRFFIAQDQRCLVLSIS